jgi:hypothetical protein
MANKPFTIFEKTISRSNGLLELHKTGPHLDENDDLIRAAIVLAVAGFDRYFTAKFCDVLVTHLKSSGEVGPDLYKILEKAGFNTEFALKLVSETVENRKSRPFRKIRTIVQNSLSAHTTHRDDAIDDLFKGLGLKDLSGHAAKKAKKKKLVSSVMKLVNIRNEIAHEAHVKQTGEPRKLDAAKIALRIEDLKIYVTMCDQIVDSNFGVKPPSSA